MKVETYKEKHLVAASTIGPDVSLLRSDVEHLIVLLSEVNQSELVHCVNDSYFLRQRLEKAIKISDGTKTT